jgi:5'-phosphate synthase pdxT subunit
MQRKIGILAIHGSVSEHADRLRQIGCEPVFVRAPQDLENLNGLILPGGESTTLSDL